MKNSSQSKTQKQAAHEYRGAKIEIDKMRKYNKYLNHQVEKLWNVVGELIDDVQTHEAIMSESGINMNWRS